MKNDFEKDLARWENGSLSLSALRARYPERDVDGIAGVFSMLQTVSAEPVPENTRCWNMVRARMAPRGKRSLGPAPLLQRLRASFQPFASVKDNFEKDLARWENGSLSLSALQARYPERDVDGIAGVFSMLQNVATEAVPEPTRSWNLVTARMAPRGQRSLGPAPLLQRLKPGFQRKVAFGMAAAVLALPPVALAANSPEVRDSVSDFVAESIFNVDADTADTSTTETPKSEPSGTSVLPQPAKGDGGSVPSAAEGGTGGGNDADAPASVSSGTPGNTGTATSSTPGSDGATAVSGAPGNAGASGEATPETPAVETPTPPAPVTPDPAVETAEGTG